MNVIQHPLPKLLCLAAFGLNVASVRADFPSQVLGNNPVVYYRLNENVTVPPADVATNIGSLGAVANGYYKGTSYHPVTGALAGSGATAASFNGAAGSYVLVPFNSALNPNGAFTVEGWFSPSVALGAGGLTCAISSGRFASPRQGWIIYQSDTGWNFRMYNENGTATSLNIAGGEVPVVGNWYHLAAAYDGTTAKLYVNGVQVASGSPAGTPSAYVPNQSAPLTIGGRSDANFWWTGSADEVAVYGSAISAATVLSHYQNGTNATPATSYNQLVLASNPLLYLPFDEPEYVLSDFPIAVNAATSGTTYDGQYYPGTDAKVAGPRPTTFNGFAADNTAAAFNGQAGGIKTPYSLNGLGAFTVGGWIKRGTTHSGRGGYFGQNDLLEIGDADNGTNIEVWINAFGTNIKVPYSFADNQWGFLVISGTTNSVTVYTNGLAAGTASSSTAGSFGSSSYSFNIGGQGIFNATGDDFLGSIDEVFAIDQPLSASQIQSLYFSANIAPVITKQPVAPSRSLVPGNVVTLSVTASGTAPLSYQWYKGTTLLNGKTATNLVFNGITAGDAGTYHVVVTNPYGSVPSSDVTLTVGAADTTAPLVQYADSSRDFTHVRLFFNEPLDANTATNPANYTISNGTSSLAVTSATLVGAPGTTGDNLVDLVTATQTAGTNYTVTINGVKDQTSPGNTIAANTTIKFTAWKLASGYLRFEHWDNLTGAGNVDITNALNNARVIADTPTTEGFISGKFDTRTIFPDDSHEQYLARITGWIVPTETDDYYFFLRSDDAGRVYLSQDSSIPDPLTTDPIAMESGCCGAFMEPGTDEATTATPIHLVANQRYGVLALLKEAGGGDYLQVAWRKASDTTTAAASLAPIPGQYLQTYVDPNTELTITQQPTDQPGVLPSPVVDFATNDFSTSDGGFTVENTTPPPPGPFLYDSTAGAWIANGSEDACTGPYNSKLTSPAFTMPVSDQVTLTFTHRYSFEPDRWDGGQVWISVNGGAYTPVAASNFVANGYPPGLIQGTGVLQNQQAFHDDSPGYTGGSNITSSVILGRFNQNDTIKVQFVGAWDECSSGSHPSWVIKNMKLAYGTAPVASTFTVAATATKQGTPISFTYQWQRNDGSGWVDILNENAATLRIFPTSADFSAQFRVVVKVAGNELASNAVKLTNTTGAPTISIARSNGTISITFTGSLQSSTSVTGPYSTITTATSPYSPPNSTTGSMFFRAVK